MWPFKTKQISEPETQLSEQDKLYVAEYRCWTAGAFPYDFLRGCGRCITDHAVRGCCRPEHNGFVAIVHDAGLHVHRLLVNGERKFAISKQDEIDAGKFLVEKRAEIVQLRDLYSVYYKQPETVQAAKPAVTKEA